MYFVFFLFIMFFVCIDRPILGFVILLFLGMLSSFVFNYITPTSGDLYSFGGLDSFFELSVPVIIKILMYSMISIFIVYVIIVIYKFIMEKNKTKELFSLYVANILIKGVFVAMPVILIKYLFLV